MLITLKSKAGRISYSTHLWCDDEKSAIMVDCKDDEDVFINIGEGADGDQAGSEKAQILTSPKTARWLADEIYKALDALEAEIAGQVSDDLPEAGPTI